jgi:hypothetical protein
LCKWLCEQPHSQLGEDGKEKIPSPSHALNPCHSAHRQSLNCLHCSNLQRQTSRCSKSSTHNMPWRLRGEVEVFFLNHTMGKSPSTQGLGAGLDGSRKSCPFSTINHPAHGEVPYWLPGRHIVYWNYKYYYNAISIYRPLNVRFPVFTMRHLWSQIKFHINNVIYFRIHRSPNCRFSAFIACKSRSRHSISCMDFLAWFVWEKNLKRAIYVGSVLHTSATCDRLYVCIQSTCIYLRYILFASHVTFSFKSSILALVFSSLTMAQP